MRLLRTFLDYLVPVTWPPTPCVFFSGHFIHALVLAGGWASLGALRWFSWRMFFFFSAAELGLDPGSLSRYNQCGGWLCIKGGADTHAGSCSYIP